VGTQDYDNRVRQGKLRPGLSVVQNKGEKNSGERSEKKNKKSLLRRLRLKGKVQWGGGRRGRKPRKRGGFGCTRLERTCGVYSHKQKGSAKARSKEPSWHNSLPAELLRFGERKTKKQSRIRNQREGKRSARGPRGSRSCIVLRGGSSDCGGKGKSKKSLSPGRAQNKKLEGVAHWRSAPKHEATSFDRVVFRQGSECEEGGKDYKRG